MGPQEGPQSLPYNGFELSLYRVYITHHHFHEIQKESIFTNPSQNYFGIGLIRMFLVLANPRVVCSTLKDLYRAKKSIFLQSVPGRQPTSPIRQKKEKEKIRVRINEEKGHMKLFTNDSNNRQARQLLKRNTKLLIHQPGNKFEGLPNKIKQN